MLSLSPPARQFVEMGDVDAVPDTGAAGHVGRAGILLRAVDAIGKAVVGNDVVELAGRLVVPRTPGRAAVQGDQRALVDTEDAAVRIGGVDPQDVEIVAGGIALDRNKGAAAVVGAQHDGVAHHRSRPAFFGLTVSRPKYQPRCQMRGSPVTLIQFAPASSER